MDSEQTYTSSLSGKAALLSETEQVMAHLAETGSVEGVRERVVEDNLLLKRTVSTRRSTWDTIASRYLIGRDPEMVSILAAVAASFLPERARHFILFYELARSDRLVYDLTVDALYGLYQSGQATVDKEDVLQWLRQTAVAGHPEIAAWSPQTRGKVASNYLTIVRDFGLLKGTQRKRFAHFYVPLATFVYVLYRLKEEGLNDRAILESADFRLFLLNERDVSLLLEEATQAGYITFQRAGAIYDLTFHYHSLAEVVHELIDQI
jgi:hypothetical protein